MLTLVVWGDVKEAGERFREGLKDSGRDLGSHSPWHPDPSLISITMPTTVWRTLSVGHCSRMFRVGRSQHFYLPPSSPSREVEAQRD